MLKSQSVPGYRQKPAVGRDTKGWRLLVENGLSAKAQMARDVALAEQTLPTVRFFCWSPQAISLGLKQKTPSWFNADGWQTAGLEWVERPTGGGIAFHGTDVSLSVIVPRSLQISLSSLMGAVCGNALALCRSLGADADALTDVAAKSRIDFCLTQTSPYAVTIGGRKVAGFALRRFKQTWLIQGSLLVSPVGGGLAQALPVSVLEQLKTKAVALGEAVKQPLDAANIARRWADHWAGWWEETLIERLARQS